MWGTRIALLTLLVTDPAQDPAALVAQLGSDRHAEAAAALEKIGADALPALRTAGESAWPEVRTRAAALVARIERAVLVRPTLVTLDYRDRPLDEVVTSLAARSRMRLVLDPANRDRWQGLRISLEEPGPVPFWRAVDRLTETARLQYNFALSTRSGIPMVYLRLSHPGHPPAGPVSYQGPFRIQVNSVEYRDEARLVRTPDGKMKRRGGPMLNIHLKIAAEPRMRVGQDDLPRRVEVLDGQGRSFVPKEQAGADRPLNWRFAHLNTVPEVYVNLWGLEPATPGPPDATLRTIKGTVRIAVEARRPDPLTVPLANAEGKTFRQGVVSLEVRGVRVEPGRRPLIDLAARIGTGPDAPGPPQTPDYFGSSFWAGGQVEVVDERGEPIAWVPGPAPAGGDEVDATLRILPDDRAAPPTQVHYYGAMRTITEVPFELHDVPCPSR